MTFDPMIPFVYRDQPVPYLTESGLVVPVRCKTGLAVSRLGVVVHMVKDAAAIVRNGRFQFAARWVCAGYGSTDVIIVTSAERFGRICESCIGTAAGPCVYRCFNATGDLLYVGSSVSRVLRMQSHAKQSRWWPDVADVTYEDFATEFEARFAERVAIWDERPLHNRQFARRRAS